MAALEASRRPSPTFHYARIRKNLLNNKLNENEIGLGRAGNCSNPRLMIQTDGQIHNTDLVITPNPFSEELTLSFDSNTEGVTTIELQDIAGRICLRQNYSALKGLNTVTLPTNNVKEGMYLLYLRAEGQRMIKKVVKR